MQLVAECCWNCHYPTGRFQSGRKFRNRMSQKEFISMIFPNINFSVACLLLFQLFCATYVEKLKVSLWQWAEVSGELFHVLPGHKSLSCSSSACTAPALASFLSTESKQCTCFPAWPLPGDYIVLITTHSCHQPKRNPQSYKQEAPKQKFSNWHLENN